MVESEFFKTICGWSLNYVETVERDCIVGRQLVVESEFFKTICGWSLNYVETIC